MQTKSRVLDDLARLASGALGVAAGMRGEIETRLREQFERALSQMDLVPREEFEAVKAMAARARLEQEHLAERLAALEARGAAKPARPRRTAPKEAPAPKKAPKSKKALVSKKTPAPKKRGRKVAPNTDGP